MVNVKLPSRRWSDVELIQIMGSNGLRWSNVAVCECGSRFSYLSLPYLGSVATNPG